MAVSFPKAEAILYSFHRLQVDLRDLQAKAAKAPHNWYAEVQGGDVGFVSDPTAKAASELACDEEIQRLKYNIRAVQRVVGDLEERKKKLVELKYWSGYDYSHSDIADRIGVSRQTVSRWRRQIISQLQEELDKQA